MRLTCIGKFTLKAHAFVGKVINVHLTSLHYIKTISGYFNLFCQNLKVKTTSSTEHKKGTQPQPRVTDPAGDVPNPDDRQEKPDHD